MNYAISNLRNISGESIRYPCKRCKNKEFLDTDVVTMHLLQKDFTEKYLCMLICTQRTISSSQYHDRKDSWSTSSFINRHGVEMRPVTQKLLNGQKTFYLKRIG